MSSTIVVLVPVLLVLLEEDLGPGPLIARVKLAARTGHKVIQLFL